MSQIYQRFIKFSSLKIFQRLFWFYFDIQSYKEAAVSDVVVKKKQRVYAMGRGYTQRVYAIVLFEKYRV